jgi:hypothetical protein
MRAGMLSVSLLGPGSRFALPDDKVVWVNAIEI